MAEMETWVCQFDECEAIFPGGPFCADAEFHRSEHYAELIQEQEGQVKDDWAQFHREANADVMADMME